MCGSKRMEVKCVTVRAPGGDPCQVEAEVCLNCGERYFTRAAAEEILAAGKRGRVRPAGRAAKP